MYLNPYLFFLLKEGSFYVWDYKNHQQFQIDLPVFKALLNVSATGQKPEDNLVTELEAAGLISSVPYAFYPWKWDTLSHIFHVGTQNIGDSKEVSAQEWAQAHIDYNLSVELESKDLFYHREGPRTPLLPNWKLLENMNVGEALLKRKTSRQFQLKPVDFEIASTLIYASFGTVHEDFSGNNPYFVGLRKTSPSGGGLHPTECFVIAWAIEGLAPGIYHYDVKTNSLTYCAEALSHHTLKLLFYGQPYADDCAFGLFLASRLDLIWKKYPHSRSYRDALIDTGLVTQTTLLTATALGLLTWETGLFNDNEVARILMLKDESFAPFFFMAFGY